MPKEKHAGAPALDSLSFIENRDLEDEYGHLLQRIFNDTGLFDFSKHFFGPASFDLAFVLSPASTHVLGQENQKNFSEDSPFKIYVFFNRWHQSDGKNNLYSCALVLTKDGEVGICHTQCSDVSDSLEFYTLEINLGNRRNLVVKTGSGRSPNDKVTTQVGDYVEEYHVKDQKAGTLRQKVEILHDILARLQAK